MLTSCLIPATPALFAGLDLLYFFGYKMEYFSSKTIPKIDMSYMTDLDLWDCLGRVNLVVLGLTAL